jgi:Holliday junction resolvasome RuvABC endonuclease subunit
MTVLEDIKQALKSLSIHVLAIPTTFYLQSPSSTLPEAQERPALPEDFFKAIE